MTSKTEKRFLINKLATALILKNGYIEIPVGGFARITERDESEETISHAIGRDWAEVTDVEPKGFVAAAVEIEETIPYKGMTFEELQADNAKQAAEKKDKPSAGRSTQLGVPAEKPKPAEALVIEEIPAEALVDNADKKTTKAK